MGAISEKLVYLNGTKQAIKQAINEDFEVIDDNTTFREYADEISSNNAKYKDLIPKETTNATNTLDISNSSGLDKALVTQYGNTYQETTTGKNLFKASSSNYPQGLNITYDSDKGTITFSGTTTGTYPTLSNFTEANIPAGTYTFSIDKALPYNLSCRFRNSSGQYPSTVILSAGELSKSITLSYDTVRLELVYSVTEVGVTIPTTTIKPMMELGSTATNWEKYTGGNPAPNPDYPQEIVNISGKSNVKVVGKNLFDVTTIRNAINGSISNNTIISNAISTSYGGVSANITGTTLSPGTYYLSLKTKIDSGSASALNKITLVGINNDEVTEIEKPTISGSYQIYVIQITINETKTITNIGVQLGYTNTNAVISYKDIMISKYSDTTYEPYKEQSFDLDLKSRNLFDKSNITTGKTFTNTGAISNLTNSFIQETYIPVSSDTDYTMSTTNDYSSETDYRLVICEYDSNKNFIKRNLGGSATGNKYTITTSSTTKYVRLCASTVTLDELQFEQNSTLTDYEPYYDINLCKIGDYKDRIYPLNGKWYLEKKKGKAVLNDNDYSTFAINAVASTFVQLLTPVIDNLFSTTTPIIDNQKLLSNYISNFGGVTANSRIRINILHQNLGTNSSSTNAEAKSAFVNKMTGKTLIFYYVLETPTTEEITESNYPTLYNQLNNIKLFEGVNHITMTNESGLDVEFDIEYYKDWKLD